MTDKCDNCGADLKSEPVPSALGGFDVRCGFCGHRHHVHAETERDEPPAPHPATPARSPVARRSRAVWLLFPAILGGTVLMLFIVHRVVDGSVYWDDVGGTTALATIGGREVVIGRTRDPGGDDKLFIDAFDSTTLAQLWEAGPYGTYTEGYRYTHWEVSGSHVVVTDFHANAHILDLATGKEQHVVTLSDKVDRLSRRTPTTPRSGRSTSAPSRSISPRRASGRHRCRRRVEASPIWQPWGDSTAP
jgi:hypothetical protein